MIRWTELTIDPADPLARRRGERAASEIHAMAVDYFAALVARGGYWSDGLMGSGATVEASRPADGVLIATWRLTGSPADAPPLAASLYLAGEEPDAVMTFQAEVVAPLATALKVGPVRDLIDEPARPLLCTVLTPPRMVPDRAEMEARKVVGDAESCLAAAFFEAVGGGR